MEHIDKDKRVEIVDIVHRFLEGLEALCREQLFIPAHMFQADQQVLQDSQGERGIEFILVLEIKVKGTGAQLGLARDILHG
jgi:hypothetical protein